MSGWGGVRPKANKYGNVKVSHAGLSFASKAEASLYDFLKLREAAGEIRDIKNQVHVYLTDARIAYVADFEYFSLLSDCTEYAEMKGYSTDVWRIKRRLWQHYGPGTLCVYGGSRGRLVLTETITTKVKP